MSEGTTWDLALVEVSNGELDRARIDPIPTPDNYPCQVCRERGFIPRVWREDCPECYGGDEYGQACYCAECEFCCGC